MPEQNTFHELGNGQRENIRPPEVFGRSARLYSGAFVDAAHWSAGVAP